jgi:hypothetical protein
MPSYRINTQTAISLIDAFVSHPELKSVAAVKAMGGTINTISLFGRPKIESIFKTRMAMFVQPPELYNGNMAWFCWNDFGITKYPPFFLAFETNDSYETTALPRYPDMRELMVSQNTFAHSGQNVGYLLGNHQINTSSYTDIVIPRQEVMQFVQNFTDRGPGDASGKFNKYPFAFFENEKSSDVKNFLEQPGISFVRYYFGYDARYSASNRLRVVLVPVDAQGKNIFNDSPSTVMLQHSWPPPPPVDVDTES